MEEECKRSINQSFGKMSFEGSFSKNSSHCSKNSYRQYMEPEILDSDKIKKGQTKGCGLFNRLIGSDPNAPHKILQEDNQFRESMHGQHNSFKLVNSDKGDKKKMHNIISSESFRMQPQNLIETSLNHKCDCISFNEPRYCPFNCECYNKPQMCSKELCCLQCYKVKLQRLPMLQGNYYQYTISQAKINEDYFNIVGSGKNKKSKPAKVKHCECRKAACSKDYCICRKNNQQCDEKCNCELPCLNREVPLYPRPKPQPQQVYVSDPGSIGSSNKSMKFDPFLYRQ